MKFDPVLIGALVTALDDAQRIVDITNAVWNVATTHVHAGSISAAMIAIGSIKATTDLLMGGK